MSPAVADACGRRALIASLVEEDPFCPEPPAAAEAWSEARIRAFFEAGGVDACPAEESASATPALLTREQARARRARCARAARVCASSTDALTRSAATRTGGG
jgi:hypothetical protein